MEEIEDGLIVNILTSLVISLLESINDQIPEHKTKARVVRKVVESIRELARLNSLPLTEELIQVCVKLWNRLLEELQILLTDLIEVDGQEQLLLPFHDTGKSVLLLEAYTTIN